MADSQKTGSFSPEEAVVLRKALDYCSAQEHCSSEVEQKLRLWQAGDKLVAEIMAHLLKEGFIDEKRYAVAFARGKHRNLQWGRLKIRFELRQKRIPPAIINQALEELDEEEYLQVLREIIEKKLKSPGKSSRENQLKVLRYAAGKGFEPDLIRKILKDDSC